jgi:8-oxo-dGTP pyrophosphatase MutT (NUDIX family)
VCLYVLSTACNLQEDDGTVKVWLTQRAANLSTHQGEVCLPGGKRDPTDVDDQHTALREAHEEVRPAEELSFFTTPPTAAPCLP